MKNFIVGVALLAATVSGAFANEIVRCEDEKGSLVIKKECHWYNIGCGSDYWHETCSFYVDVYQNNDSEGPISHFRNAGKFYPSTDGSNDHYYVDNYFNDTGSLRIIAYSRLGNIEIKPRFPGGSNMKMTIGGVEWIFRGCEFSK